MYLLMFTSGSMVYMEADNKYLVLVFIVSLIAWYLMADRKISEKFVLYVCVFLGFQFVIVLYTDGSLSIGSIVSTTLQLLVAYLGLKVIGERFVEIYLKVLTFLAVISLFGFLSDQLGLLDGLVSKLPLLVHDGNPAYEGIFYLFRYTHQWGRNNSIFYEPGAYQGFLNAGLFMLLFVKTKFSNRQKTVYIFLLLITLLSTFSTTGFLIFAVMFGVFMLQSKILTPSSKLALVAVVGIIGLVFAAEFRYVVVDKVTDYLSSEALTDRSNLRSFDVRLDLEIFRRNIFGVGFNDYLKAVSSIGLVSEGQSSSNGVTRVLAIYGLPFWLFIYASYFMALRRLLHGNVAAVVAFGLLLMFFIGESYYVFRPICMAIIAGAFIYHPSRASTIENGDDGCVRSAESAARV